MKIASGAVAVLVGSALGVAGLTSPAAANDHFDDFPGNATTCEDAGLGGELITDLVEGSISGDDSQFLNIDSVPEGWDVTGVVVKGGPNYRVYDGAYDDMRSPDNDGDNVPAISHWFVCATETTTTTPPTTTPPETEEPSEEPTDEPGEEPSEEPEPEETLPNTGASNGALLAAGGLLALGGAALAGRAALASRK